MAHINGIGNVPFSDEGIANLSSMAKLIDAGFRITMDTDKEDAINVYTKDNRIIKFTHSKNGLYFHDTEDRKMTFLNSQYENSLLYTCKQVKEAKVVCDLYRKMSYPSINDFKNAVKYNMIDDCPVKVEHINVAEDIFGKDIHALKGKTVKKQPYHVDQDIIQVPREVMRLHRNVTLGMDLIFINGLAFFITVTRKIKFVTVENVTSKGKKIIMKCAGAVIDFYKHRGFRVVHTIGDNEFSYLEKDLNDNYNIEFNAPSANEHVGEIEHMIRMVKECIHAIISSFPWKKAVPRLIVKESVKHAVKMIN